MTRPRLLFVTGKLAEPALRRVLADLAPRAEFDFDVAVLPITVVALASTEWIARHLHTPPGVQKIVLPGLCVGELSALTAATGLLVERGPEDLRDLPDYFGYGGGPPADYGRYDIAILAEINHAPRLDRQQLLAEAVALREAGADLIDVGCDPGPAWSDVGDAVKACATRGCGCRSTVSTPTRWRRPWRRVPSWC